MSDSPSPSSPSAHLPPHQPHSPPPPPHSRHPPSSSSSRSVATSSILSTPPRASPPQRKVSHALSNGASAGAVVRRTATGGASSSSSASTSSSTPRERRSSRKARHHHGVHIPADALLNFSSYHPPTPSSNDSATLSSFHNHHYFPASSSSSSSSSSFSFSSQSHNGSSLYSYRPREQFVQANFRFLVHDPGDDPSVTRLLRTCELVADGVVPWSCIDRVILPRPSDCCPICLYPLQCPRVTRCGHVFDHVCMLQLFSHSPNSKNVRCPLCSCPVTEDSLRPCAFATASSPTIGSPLEMTLVTRQRGSMLCHPANSAPPANAQSQIVPVVKASETPLFSRFAFTHPSFLLQLIDADEKDLRQVLSEDPSLAPFVNVALADLNTRRKDIRARPAMAIATLETTESSSISNVDERSNIAHSQKNPVTPLSSSPSSNFHLSISSPAPGRQNQTTPTLKTNASANSRKKNDSTDNSNVNVSEPVVETTTGRTNTLNNAHNNHHANDKRAHSSQNSSNRPVKGPWFFYQDAGSGNTFLHPVNHRCLSTELRHDIASVPALRGDVLEVERHTMDESTRKRYRFLEHLPDGCEFAFVELDLTHILSEHTRAVHEQELRDRRANRRKREIEHARETERVEKEQSDCLREYFSSAKKNGLLSMSSSSSSSLQHANNNNLHHVNPPHVHVDRTDETNFPKLSDADEQGLVDPAAAADDAARDDTDPQWGPSVSSYSSVTSNMGLFPALGASSAPRDIPNRSSSTHQQQQQQQQQRTSRSWGSTANSPSPSPSTPNGLHTHPHPHPITSSSSTPLPLAHSPQTLKGVWAVNNPQINGHTNAAGSPSRRAPANGFGRATRPGNSSNNVTPSPTPTSTSASSTVTCTHSQPPLSSSSTATATATPVQEVRRNGRRSNGKSTLLLSTAGAQARR